MRAITAPVHRRLDSLHVGPALVGSLIGFVAVVALPLRLVDTILLMAPLVLVPIGLRLIGTKHRIDEAFLKTIRHLQLPSALILLSSFAFDQGVTSAILAVPWAVVTGVMAVWGIVRLSRQDRVMDPAIGTNLALLFIVVGGASIVLSRGGYRPLGFSHEIIQLTGVHFHYAGFVLPLLLSLVAERFTRTTQVGGIAAIATTGVLISIPLLAVGITLSPSLEVVAALALVGATMIYSYMQYQLAIRSTQFGVVVLLVTSSASLACGMVLAAVYALGEYFGTHWLSIPAMVPLHGVLNSFGFAMCGLLGWTRQLQLDTTAKL